MCFVIKQMNSDLSILFIEIDVNFLSWVLDSQFVMLPWIAAHNLPQKMCHLKAFSWRQMNWTLLALSRKFCFWISLDVVNSSRFWLMLYLNDLYVSPLLKFLCTASGCQAKQIFFSASHHVLIWGLGRQNFEWDLCRKADTEWTTADNEAVT